VLPDAGTLGVFLAAALALLIVPGPAVLFIVARSVEQGRLAGVVSTLGIGTGSLVHVAAAALGLSSLLVSSATAFSVVKYAGAAYLVFLGLRTLLAKDEAAAEPGARARSLGRLYRQGVVVNVLNPKTALFFFAFLPQFVDPARGSVGLQIATLGCLFVVLGLASDGLYALLAGTAGAVLRRSIAFARMRRWVAGSVFVGLGLTTALSGSRRQA